MDFHVITSVGEALIMKTSGDGTRATTIELISEKELLHYRRVIAAHLASRRLRPDQLVVAPEG